MDVSHERGTSVSDMSLTPEPHTAQAEREREMTIPTQPLQLILHISNSKGQVDGFMGELTSAKRL